jgi:hypothetical protein
MMNGAMSEPVAIPTSITVFSTPNTPAHHVLRSRPLQQRRPVTSISVLPIPSPRTGRARRRTTWSPRAA